MKYCHRGMNNDIPQPCLKEECSMWSESEEDCLEVVILRNKVLKIQQQETVGRHDY